MASANRFLVSFNAERQQLYDDLAIPWGAQWAIERLLAGCPRDGFQGATTAYISCIAGTNAYASAKLADVLPSRGTHERETIFFEEFKAHLAEAAIWNQYDSEEQYLKEDWLGGNHWANQVRQPVKIEWEGATIQAQLGTPYLAPSCAAARRVGSRRLIWCELPANSNERDRAAKYLATNDLVLMGRVYQAIYPPNERAVVMMEINDDYNRHPVERLGDLTRISRGDFYGEMVAFSRPRNLQHWEANLELLFRDSVVGAEFRATEIDCRFGHESERIRGSLNRRAMEVVSRTLRLPFLPSHVEACIAGVHGVYILDTEATTEDHALVTIRPTSWVRGSDLDLEDWCPSERTLNVFCDESAKHPPTFDLEIIMGFLKCGLRRVDLFKVLRDGLTQQFQHVWGKDGTKAARAMAEVFRHEERDPSIPDYHSGPFQRSTEMAETLISWAAAGLTHDKVPIGSNIMDLQRNMYKSWSSLVMQDAVRLLVCMDPTGTLQMNQIYVSSTAANGQVTGPVLLIPDLCGNPAIVKVDAVFSEALCNAGFTDVIVCAPWVYDHLHPNSEHCRVVLCWHSELVDKVPPTVQSCPNPLLTLTQAFTSDQYVYRLDLTNEAAVAFEVRRMLANPISATIRKLSSWRSHMIWKFGIDHWAVTELACAIKNYRMMLASGATLDSTWLKKFEHLPTEPHLLLNGDFEVDARLPPLAYNRDINDLRQAMAHCYARLGLQYQTKLVARSPEFDSSPFKPSRYLHSVVTHEDQMTIGLHVQQLRNFFHNLVSSDGLSEAVWRTRARRRRQLPDVPHVDPKFVALLSAKCALQLDREDNDLMFSLTVFGHEVPELTQG